MHDPGASGALPQSGSDAAGTATDAALFAALWAAASDIIGTASMAVFVRRAAGWAARSAADMADLRIERSGFGYAYVLPPSWSVPHGSGSGRMVRALLEELGPLLAEMTGPVVLRRLAAEPALREAGLATDGDVARWLGGG